MGIKVNVNVPKGGDGDFGKLLDQAMLDGMRDALIIVTNAARNNLAKHTKTGTGRRSVGFEEPRLEGYDVIGRVFAGGNGAPYLAELEFGSGLWGPKHAKYPILPVHKKALAWGRSGVGPAMAATEPLAQAVNMHLGAAGGANMRLSGAIKTPILRALAKGQVSYSQVYIVRRGVMHPGHPPMPFLQPALDDNIEAIEEAFAKRIDAMMQRWGGGT